MSDNDVERSSNIQQHIRERLAEFAYADAAAAERISRHMAEIATLGKAFGENTLPLFLQMPRQNSEAIADVALAIKVQLEELTDALVDLRRELPDWTEFFASMREH